MTLDLFFEIADIFEKNGFSLFLTGGSVRDYLLYGNFDDMDLVTNANFDQMQQFLNFKSVFLKFQSGKFVYKNKEIDVTTLRKEEEYNDFRHPRKITVVNSPKEEYKRRDFTINALYMDKEGKILDYCFGKKDLKDGIIKMIGDPLKRFNEDPLRILRALRFSFVLNFEIDPLIEYEIKNNKHLIKHLNYHKIIEELSKFKGKPYEVRKFLSRYEIDKEIPLFYEKNKKEYLNLWNKSFLNTSKKEINIIKELEKMQKKSLLGQVFLIKGNNDFQKNKFTIFNYLEKIKQNYNFIENVVNNDELTAAINKGKRISFLAIEDKGNIDNYEALLGVSVLILKDVFFKTKNVKEKIMNINSLNLIIDISLLSLAHALEVIHISSKRVTILNFNYFKTKNSLEQNILNQLILNKVLIGYNSLSINYPNSLFVYSLNNNSQNDIGSVSKKMAYLNFFDFIKNSNR